jgi:HD-like signal output (HDOD) protein
MTYLSIAVSVLVAVLAVWVIRTILSRPSTEHWAQPSATDVEAHEPPAAPRLAAQPAFKGTIAASVAVVGGEPCPPELAAFVMSKAAQLPRERRDAITAVFRNVPRPPRLLQHLLSPDFVGAASSAELVDLIASEPLIAAKVLATVNSPFYALRTPVQSIGQAVSYLGLNAVRSVCLQYILIDSFKADSRERQQVLDATWRASALASELMQNLSNKLDLHDPGSLSSAVVLSFLGRLATAGTMPRGLLAKIPSRGFLPRVAAEQAMLGLCSAEIGRLLMTAWALPEAIVDDATGIDRILVTPADSASTARALRHALCYLCARLGERLADGELESLDDFDLATDAGPDLFHLRSHFNEALAARVAEKLRSPDLGASVRRILRATEKEAVAA